jgi:8-oxo-dGTP pyrophosphatase MutT (NUDIX family)
MLPILPASQIDQASSIPFRRNGVEWEFCLITSIGRRRWGFPKGAIELGETSTETALKEACEEAGLLGRIVGPCIGRYSYRKWDRELVVACFLMAVTHVQDQWLESDLRSRRWVTADEARRLLARPEQRVLLDIALEHLTASAAQYRVEVPG